MPTEAGRGGVADGAELGLEVVAIEPAEMATGDAHRVEHVLVAAGEDLEQQQILGRRLDR